MSIKTKLNAKWIGTALGALFVFLLLSWLVALPVKWLWNGLVPELFGGPRVSWLQAWGLQLLASFLLNPTKANIQKP